MSVHDAAIKLLEDNIAAKREQLAVWTREITDIQSSIALLAMAGSQPEKKRKTRDVGEGSVSEKIIAIVSERPGLTRAQIKEHFGKPGDPDWKELNQKLNNQINYMVNNEIISRKGDGGSEDTYKVTKKAQAS